MRNDHKNKLARVEIIYIFTVFTVTLLSFSLLHIASKRNSEFSKNLVVARLHSQEGVKTIIDLKKQDKKSIIVGSHSYSWSQLLHGKISLPECANTSDLTITCADFSINNCSLNPNQKNLCIEESTKSYKAPFWKMPERDNKIFSRKVRITGTENNAKNVTVFVWWTDKEGLHTSPITYKLSEN